MIGGEVNTVENIEKNQEQPRQYVPRPAWQVWGARVGLAVFILFVIYQYVCVARGGL